MAKRIKAIKCPQCGSTSATNLRTDYYKCNSCGTEFFLDNDDINIHHNYNYPKPNIDKKRILKIVLFIALGFIGLNIFIGVIGLIFSKKETVPNYNTYSSPTNNATYKKEEIVYDWDYQSNEMFLDANGKPHLAVVGNLKKSTDRFNDEKNFNVYIGLFNPITSQKEWVKPLMETPIKLSSSDVKLSVFQDNNLYIIIKSKYVFQLDRKTLTFKSVLEDYVKNNENLSIGIAKIEFKYDNYGSAYQIVNNEGKTLVYYPLINKTIPEKQVYLEQRKKLPNPETKTAFVFSSKSSDFPEEKIQLIKYTYSYQYGYPKDDARFSWSRDYGRSGIFTDRDPYQKRLINNWMKEGSRIINYKDFTPNRLYFSAKVIAFNDSFVIITFKPTPAEDDMYQLQFLDPETGAIQKTFPTDLTRAGDKGYLLKDGFIIKNSSKYSYFDYNGKLQNTFEGYNPKFNQLN